MAPRHPVQHALRALLPPGPTQGLHPSGCDGVPAATARQGSRGLSPQMLCQWQESQSRRHQRSFMSVERRRGLHLKALLARRSPRFLRVTSSCIDEVPARNVRPCRHRPACGILKPPRPFPLACPALLLPLPRRKTYVLVEPVPIASPLGSFRAPLASTGTESTTSGDAVLEVTRMLGSTGTPARHYVECEATACLRPPAVRDNLLKVVVQTRGCHGACHPSRVCPW